MKKKIFITNQYMELGGVERSLIGLLDAIDYSQYEVDVFIHRHIGDLMPFINPKANLLPEIKEYTTLTRPIKEIVKEGYWRIAVGRLKAKWRAKKYKGEKTNAAIFQYVADETTHLLPQITTKEYDLAISFQQPHNIVNDKIKAKKKIAWIHTDYSTVEVDVKAELPVWNHFDAIASISESSTDAFLTTFPTLKNKVVVIENMLSPDFVKRQAELEDIELKGEIKLLTVGRFCYPKAFDRAVQICAELVNMGLPIKWYAIGYGDEITIQNAIKESSMENHFIIIGKKSNPYPYMKACNLYVQPSRYEGKAVTVREAQMLCKPVVITKFPTSSSQLTDGFDGVIIPMEIKEAAVAIKNLLEDKNRLQELSDNCRVTDYGNLSNIEKLYNLL
ncbi:MAG: glycosyltransferase [Phocaeicola sp.]